MNLFNYIFDFKIIKKNKKEFLLPHADVAERSHVVTHRPVSVRHVDVCMRDMCA